MAQQQQQQPAQQSVASEVYILASTHQLGTPQGQYKAKLAILSARAVVILTLIGILGGAGLLAYDIATTHAISTWGLLGLLGLAAGLWLGINALRYYGLRIYLFTEGLVQVKGDKITVVRWDQIKTVWQNVQKRFISSFYIGTVHSYTVQRDDGKKITFDDGLKDVEALGNIVTREVTSRLVPDVIATYNAGEPVTFGKLSVSIHGISNDGDIVLWNQIKGVQVVKGTLAINKDGQWLNWPGAKVAKIPNFPVFMALVEYVLKGQ